MKIHDIRRANMLALRDQFPSRAKFAEYLERSPSQMNQVIGVNPTREIGHSLARHVEVKFGKPDGWMDIDHTNQTIREPSKHYSVDLGHVDLYESDEPLHSSEVNIPFFSEVELSAGNGFTDVSEIATQQMRFSLSTLSQFGVSPSSVACCKVNGDSMEPVLPDGSSVVINTSDTAIKDGKVYAINHGGLLRVKYLYRMPYGGLRIRSANADYQDEELSGETSKEVRIIGRVFWYAAAI